MRELTWLLEKLNSESLLTAATFAFDSDEVLDQRDQPPFDTEWVRVHRLFKDAPLSGDQQDRITAVSKAAYLTTAKLTKNYDLAAYVSDDFDLICRGVVADAAEPWLNALWLQYRAQIFPRGELEAVPGKLRNLVSLPA